MKRLFPFLQLYGTFSVFGLRLRRGPLVPSFRRLGIFAFSSHPGVRGFPTLWLRRPFRHFPRSLAFQRAFAPLLLPISLCIPKETSRVRAHETQARYCRWRVSGCPFRALRLPSIDTGEIRFTCVICGSFPPLNGFDPYSRQPVSGSTGWH